MSKNLLPISIFALAVAIAWASLPTAAADPPSPGTSCEKFQAIHSAARRAEWMDQNLAAGRSRFVPMSHEGGGTWLCAW
jgi:hypothetical protein